MKAMKTKATQKRNQAMSESTTPSCADALIHEYVRLFPAEAASHIERMSPEEIVPALALVSPPELAETVRRMDPDVVAACVPAMQPEMIRTVFTRVEPAVGVSVFVRMERKDQDRAFSHLPHHLVREYRSLMSYPAESAGSLMDSRVTMFREYSTVEEALVQLRAVKGRDLLDLCVVDRENQLTGMVPLHRLVKADLGTRLTELVDGESIHIPDMAEREEVVALMEKYQITTIPVVNADGFLMGVIRHDTIFRAAQAEITEDLQTMFGAGREERAWSPVSFSIRKRLPWLEVNLVTAFLASFVVSLFEDTIAQITALAVFLPIVAGQSGNTGCQALAVVMRGLALREVRTGNWWRVTRKEAAIGFINGLVVAATTGLAVGLWTGITAFGLVIGISMVASMLVAGVAGALIPLLLNAIGQDPAQSSSIILTTVTDVVGFMSFLGLATLMMGMLTPTP